MSHANILSIVIVVLYCSLVLHPRGALGGATEECQARNETYRISDSEQCDKYYECAKSGKLTERICDDGFVFSEPIRQCDYPHSADCSKRPKLQDPKPDDPNCARRNGFYAFPSTQSCQKFYHCLEGKAYEKTCPEGIIFDPAKGTCMHPDLSTRVECTASMVLGFQCPNLNHRFAKLRFGDHDRHAHPTDCRKFMICLMDGNPRLGGCPFRKVFNPKTGFCDSPKNVVNCVDYYKGKDLKVEEGAEADNSSEENSIESSSEESNEKFRAPKPSKVEKSSKSDKDKDNKDKKEKVNNNKEEQEKASKKS